VKYLNPEELRLVQRAKYTDHSSLNSPISTRHAKLSNSFLEAVLEITQGRKTKRGFSGPWRFNIEFKGPMLLY
jgi:hypothetical protein